MKNLLSAVTLMAVGFGYAEVSSATALPCGPEAVLDYVGQIKYPNQLNPGQLVYNAAFNPPAPDTTSASSPFQGLDPSRFTNRRNVNCKSGACDTYYSYGAFDQALMWVKGNLDAKPQANVDRTFACTGSLTDRIREVAEFFALVTQETNAGTPGISAGAAWGFAATDECYGKSAQDGTCVKYDYDAVNNINYNGRGPIQLTGKANYQWFGNLLKGYGDSSDYVSNPDLLTQSSQTGWVSAFAYQMIGYTETTSTYTKPSLHTALIQSLFSSSTWGKGGYGQWGFGNTISITNGGLECKAQTVGFGAMNRINNYLELLIRFGVDVRSVTLTKKDGTTQQRTLADLSKNINSPWYDNKAWEVLYLSQPISDHFVDTANKATDLTSIVLTYNDDVNGLQNERLDCNGYKTFDQ